MGSSPQSREFLMGSFLRPSTIDGVLDIALHHARDIHNICIYGNQDVYAKFSITQTQDAVYSTQPIKGGGKNPVFNQSLQIPISKLDAVLKCEIWMMSVVRTYLEDQLLGFVLVPLSDLFGQGTVTEDYSLSSTDLFHNPAGTVRLSLSFHLRGADIPVFTNMPMSSFHGLATVGNGTDVFLTKSITSGENDETHAVTAIGNPFSATVDYNNVEFADLQSAFDDQRLVSLYLRMASNDAHIEEHACDDESNMRIHLASGMNTRFSEREFSSGATFLQLGSSSITELDDEMGMDKREQASYLVQDGNGSPSKGSCLSLNFPLSNNASIVSGMELKTEEVQLLDSKPASCVDMSTHFPLEGNSSQGSVGLRSLTSAGSTLDKTEVNMGTKSNGQETRNAYMAPVVSISLEPEEPVVEQQIVDMYMKSMQQFTESLAMMKLPVNLESTVGLRELESEPRAEKKVPTSEPSKKDGQKVFYGSRAFF